MTLLASRLNGARFTSVLADIQAQFPIPGGLLSGEQTALASYQTKMAHAIADNEGTDVVAEIAGNAVVTVPFVTGVTVGAASSGPGSGTVG